MVFKGLFSREVQKYINLAPVIQRLDNTIHWINLYPVDNTKRFPLTCLLNSDLSVGLHYPPYIQLGPVYLASWAFL